MLEGALDSFSNSHDCVKSRKKKDQLEKWKNIGNPATHAVRIFSLEGKNSTLGWLFIRNFPTHYTAAGLTTKPVATELKLAEARPFIGLLDLV